jgi:S1-C subfamily serine protease
MNNRQIIRCTGLIVLAAVLVFAGTGTDVYAQNFDFDSLRDHMADYTVILDLKVTFSFGMQTSEQEERQMGTVVTEDGLVVFDGTFLSHDQMFSNLSGMNVKSDPTRIDITFFNGDTFRGKFLGVDRFTRLGFVRIENPDRDFTPVRFVRVSEFSVGSWLAVHFLLPEFVTPPVAADVGMISANLESPESFTLTIGFNQLEFASVLYDEKLRPVGMLGTLMDPTSPNTNASGMLESLNSFDIPMLGVITADRLDKLIAEPPQKGEVDRAWLGISLQALTADLGEFLSADVSGGIIVNNIVTGSPAEKAGLAVGDIIFAINGQPVEVDREEKLPIFQRLIAEMGPGVSVELSVLRQDQEALDTLTLITTLEPVPLAAADADEYENEELEFTVRNLVFADYLFQNLDPDEFNGVIVSKLKPGGLAHIGGMRIGDIIQRIDDQPIESVEDAEAAMRVVGDVQPEEVVFFVWRDNRTLFLNVKTQ